VPAGTVVGSTASAARTGLAFFVEQAASPAAPATPTTADRNRRRSRPMDVVYQAWRSLGMRAWPLEERKERTAGRRMYRYTKNPAVVSGFPEKRMAARPLKRSGEEE